MQVLTLALAVLAGTGTPQTTTETTADARRTTTGMWVGLRGGPPKLRTALAAALQTQALLRGVIDRVAPDVASLVACDWSELDCFVALGERHGSRVLLVAELTAHGGRQLLRVARINVELAQVIVEYRMEVDPSLAAIDTANHAIAGLTGEVVAAPRAVETAEEAAAPARTRPKGRARKGRRARR